MWQIAIALTRPRNTEKKNRKCNFITAYSNFISNIEFSVEKKSHTQRQQCERTRWSVVHSYAEFFDCNSQTQFGIEFFEEVFIIIFLYFSARESQHATSSQANVTDLWKYFFLQTRTAFSSASLSCLLFFSVVCWSLNLCWLQFLLFYSFLSSPHSLSIRTIHITAESSHSSAQLETKNEWRQAKMQEEKFVYEKNIVIYVSSKKQTSKCVPQKWFALNFPTRKKNLTY